MSSQSVIIHEGYLFKTPPLDKFFVNWKKRWFVLSQRNLTFDLIYYTDPTKKEKKNEINIRKITKINPVHSTKTKDNTFSLEMEDGRKFMLRAPDREGKSIWVAKLLESTKEGSAYHVTVPAQPAADYAQCIVKLTTPLKINVISSFDCSSIMSIPFDRIRRFGCQVVLSSDIVWFETCDCHEDMEEFQFFIVALGIEKAYQIVQEYKKSMELALREHMIMEEGDQSQYLYSYIVKSHYGHSDYPSIARDRILQSSIISLSTSGDSVSLSDLNKLARSRSSLPHMGPAPGGGSMSGRKISDATLLSPMDMTRQRSPSPSPSPTSPKSRLTLEQFQKSPRSSRSSSKSGLHSNESSAGAEFDSGVNFEEIDQSRFSAPVYSTASARPLPPKQRSFDEPPAALPPRGGKPTLANFRVKSSDHSAKMSLADVQATSDLYLMQKKSKNKGRRGTDSADSLLSAGSDYTGLQQHKNSGNMSAYDHLSPHRSPSSGYDHLPEKMKGMSLQSAAAGRGYSNGRQASAYANF